MDPATGAKNEGGVLPSPPLCITRNVAIAELRSDVTTMLRTQLTQAVANDPLFPADFSPPGMLRTLDRQYCDTDRT